MSLRAAVDYSAITDWSLYYYSIEGVNSLSAQRDPCGSERKTPGHRSSGQRSRLEEVRIFR